MEHPERCSYFWLCCIKLYMAKQLKKICCRHRAGTIDKQEFTIISSLERLVLYNDASEIGPSIVINHVTNDAMTHDIILFTIVVTTDVVYCRSFPDHSSIHEFSRKQHIGWD